MSNLQTFYHFKPDFHVRGGFVAKEGPNDSEVSVTEKKLRTIYRHAIAVCTKYCNNSPRIVSRQSKM